MAEFKKEKTEYFLATVRKYMQLRGAITQKDLAEKTDTGISTMSRFLSQKSSDLNPALISRIVASLDIPLSEIIDFVEEDFSERFVRLVRFHKADFDETASTLANSEEEEGSSIFGAQEFQDDDSIRNREIKQILKPKKDLSIKEKFDLLTPKQKIFLSEFLNLNLEEKDVIVDVGNNLLQYFKLKGMDI